MNKNLQHKREPLSLEEIGRRYQTTLSILCKMIRDVENRPPVETIIPAPPAPLTKTIKAKPIKKKKVATPKPKMPKKKRGDYFDRPMNFPGYHKLG